MDNRLDKIIKNLPLAEILGDASCIVNDIVFDSRKAVAGSLFVAQKGVASDGHTYIPTVFAQGCRAIVCEEAPDVIPADACVVIVPDTHEALGQIASAFYGNPSAKMKLVGVTGTNGKTTIATLLYKLMTKLGHKAGLFSTVTNFIGTQEIAATHTTPDAVTLNRSEERR